VRIGSRNRFVNVPVLFPRLETECFWLPPLSELVCRGQGRNRTALYTPDHPVVRNNSIGLSDLLF
jgi:hypothetical protein